MAGLGVLGEDVCEAGFRALGILGFNATGVAGLKGNGVPLPPDRGVDDADEIPDGLRELVDRFRG